ncbi:hypothetical protein ACFWWT_45165 [Streptomyces sp. NPDC058676]|uniref:hypothetical protein n=1 Tax=unclassified Streptomyces TaxID=2593676 RepID=UPI00364CABF2
MNFGSYADRCCDGVGLLAGDRRADTALAHGRDLIDGHWRPLSAWGAVPKTLVWDNEAGVGRGRLTAEFAAFAGLLATRIHLCRPRDPEAKGLVERANGYLETSSCLAAPSADPATSTPS